MASGLTANWKPLDAMSKQEWRQQQALLAQARDSEFSGSLCPIAATWKDKQTTNISSSGSKNVSSASNGGGGGSSGHWGFGEAGRSRSPTRTQSSSGSSTSSSDARPGSSSCSSSSLGSSNGAHSGSVPPPPPSAASSSATAADRSRGQKQHEVASMLKMLLSEEDDDALTTSPSSSCASPGEIPASPRVGPPVPGRRSFLAGSEQQAGGGFSPGSGGAGVGGSDGAAMGSGYEWERGRLGGGLGSDGVGSVSCRVDKISLDRVLASARAGQLGGSNRYTSGGCGDSSRIAAAIAATSGGRAGGGVGDGMEADGLVGSPPLTSSSRCREAYSASSSPVHHIIHGSSHGNSSLRPAHLPSSLPSSAANTPPRCFSRPVHHASCLSSSSCAPPSGQPCPSSLASFRPACRQPRISNAHSFSATSATEVEGSFSPEHQHLVRASSGVVGGAANETIDEEREQPEEDGAPEEIQGVEGICLNVSEVEERCREMDERRIMLESIQINPVTLSSSELSASDLPERVLYVLTFATSPSSAAGIATAASNSSSRSSSTGPSPANSGKLAPMPAAAALAASVAAAATAGSTCKPGGSVELQRQLKPTASGRAAAERSSKPLGGSKPLGSKPVRRVSRVSDDDDSDFVLG